MLSAKQDMDMAKNLEYDIIGIGEDIRAGNSADAKRLPEYYTPLRMAADSNIEQVTWNKNVFISII